MFHLKRKLTKVHRRSRHKQSSYTAASGTSQDIPPAPPPPPTRPPPAAPARGESSPCGLRPMRGGWSRGATLAWAGSASWPAGPDGAVEARRPGLSRGPGEEAQGRRLSSLSSLARPQARHCRRHWLQVHGAASARDFRRAGAATEARRSGAGRRGLDPGVPARIWRREAATELRLGRGSCAALGARLRDRKSVV